MASNGSSASDSKNVWKFIDPKATENPEIPTVSRRPTPTDVNPAATYISDLTAIQLEDFKYRNTVWKEEKLEIQEIERRLEGVQNKILGSISENLIPQLKGASTVKEILFLLSNKFRPSDQARRQEVIQKWNALKSAPTARMILPWLDEWEMVFQEAKEMNLSLVESPQAQYDFLFATSPLNQSWVTTNLVNIGLDLENGKTVSEFSTYIKEFRQHQRLNEIFSRTADSSSSMSNSAGVFSASKNDSNEKIHSEPSTIHKGRKQNGEKICLCELSHLYEKCFYINYANTKQPANFKFREEIFEKINQKLMPNSMENLRKSLKSKFSYDPVSTPLKALKKEYAGFTQNGNHSESQNNDMGVFTTSLGRQLNLKTTLMTVDQNSLSEFHLTNHWVLDSGSDVHICNDQYRHNFQKVEETKNHDYIISGTTKYPVEAWGTCKVYVSTNKGNGFITLTKVALIPGFMTSLISLHLMNTKGVHWNSMTPLQMIQSDGSFFCKLFQIGRHWTFERIPIDIKTSQTNICNSRSAFTGGIINKITRHKKFDKLQLHRIFGHPSPEVIDRIADAAREGTITVLETKPSPKSIKCETCALSKAHQKISRISDKEHPQTKPFERITLDLIPMREGFNSNTQIIHFQCAKTLFNMIFTMYTKSESLKYTRKTLKMIKSIGHQVKYLHLDGESTLQKGLDDLAIEEGIQIERTAPRTPEQNGQSEVNGRWIILKARAFAIEANLPQNLWPQIVITVGYIMNRTPTKKLD